MRLNLRNCDTAVVAVGGNAIERDGDPWSMEAVNDSVKPILDLFYDRGLAFVHGNGIQVDVVEQENASSGVSMSPGAVIKRTQELIGDIFMRSISRQTEGWRATEVDYTKVVVDPSDLSPVKGIGLFVLGRETFDEKGIPCVEDSKRNGWFREAVASPVPLGLAYPEWIQDMIAREVIAICGGGGGIPVVENGDGYSVISQRAVIDKDATARLIAEAISAQVLLILTKENGFYERFGTPRQRFVHKLSPEGAYQAIEENPKGGGSMNPKLKAAADFAASDSGRISVITSIEEAERLVGGDFSCATVIRAA